MQKLNIDKQTIVFCVLAIFLAAELFILLPWGIKKTFSLSKKASKLKQDVLTAERDWANKDTFLKKKEALSEEIKSMHTRLVSPRQESRLLSFISASSKDFEVDIQSLSPGEFQDYSADEPVNFKYLPINIKADGKFHNLAMFLEYLQNSRYFLEVKELSIKSGYSYNSIKMTICGLTEAK